MTETPRTCTTCGQPLRPHAAFCSSCGASWGAPLRRRLPVKVIAAGVIAACVVTGTAVAATRGHGAGPATDNRPSDVFPAPKVVTAPKPQPSVPALSDALAGQPIPSSLLPAGTTAETPAVDGDAPVDVSQKLVSGGRETGYVEYLLFTDSATATSRQFDASGRLDRPWNPTGFDVPATCGALPDDAATFSCVAPYFDIVIVTSAEDPVQAETLLRAALTHAQSVWASL